MARTRTTAWTALPYVVGAAWVAFFTVSLGRLCSLGSDPSFPHVAPGTPRFRSCTAEAPSHPWLLVLVVGGAVLGVGAAVLRGRRVLAWALVGALVLAMLLYDVHVQGLSQYAMPRT